MQNKLEGKTVIITGGAKGIGYHIADKFLQNKAKTAILLDLDEMSGDKASTELQNKYGQGKALFLKCNVITDLEIISEHIIRSYKKIDVLVNNAGCEKENSINDTLALNTVAVIEWTVKFLEHMSAADIGGAGGTIINISSVLGVTTCPYWPIYSASKHAVIGFTKTIGHIKNYKNHGIRIMALCPGFTRTALVNFGQPLENMAEQTKEFIEKCEWQDPDVVGEAAVDIFNRGDSGTVWISMGGRPVMSLT